MGTYDLWEIIHRWERGLLTPEQAIGQILQHLQSLAERLAALENYQHATARGQRKGKGNERPS
jgi:hypothetical protein